MQTLSQTFKKLMHSGAWVFLFVLIVLVPLLGVLVEPIQSSSAWNAWREWDRMATLLSHSLALALLSMCVAVPAGAVLGISMERTAVPGRTILSKFVILSLFLPLPVTAVAWQIVMGRWLPPIVMEPGAIAWRPWNQGLLPAAWVHAMAAIPWVAWIVSTSLNQTDPALEDEARIQGGPRGLIRRVLLPRVSLAILASAFFVAAQTSTEIVVTDAMMVRTFAEEIYTQLVGNPAGVASSVVIMLPVWFVASVIAVLLARKLIPRTFPSDMVQVSRYRIHSWLSWFGWLIITLVLLIPIVALIQRTGSDSGGWSIGFFVTQMRNTTKLSGLVLVRGVLVALITGILTSYLVARFCWSLRTRIHCVALVAIVLALIPGPLIGFGLKESIFALMSLEDGLLAFLNLKLENPPIRSLLYSQPSPLPGIWVCVIRFVPVAMAMIYPAICRIPRELNDLATIEGVNHWTMVGWPMLRGAILTSTIAVGALCLGEVSASKLVVPPHWNLFILDLFNQMHYGAESGVAAMCLIQVVVVGICLGLAQFVLDRFHRAR